MANNRRDFVKAAAGLGLAASASAAAGFGEIPKRKLGRTGLDVTILGLGGARVGQLDDHDQAIETIQRCHDLGVTYFDTAAAGAYGLSQKRYGIALEGRDRTKLVFGTKTRHRTRAHSQLDLNQSLANLKTDYLDLYQVHNVMHEEDLDFIFGPNGVMEMIEKAKKEGKIRFVGVTGHMDPLVLKKACEMYDFDTVLIPLSVTDGARRDFSFEHTTLPVAVKKSMGVLAMKTTGVGAIEGRKISTLDEMLRYVWSLPVSTAILGCETTAQVEADVRIAASMANSKMSSAEMEQQRSKWAKAELAPLEPWKVDQSNRTAGLPRYLGD